MTFDPNNKKPKPKLSHSHRIKRLSTLSMPIPKQKKRLLFSVYLPFALRLAQLIEDRNRTEQKHDFAERTPNRIQPLDLTGRLT